MDLSHFKVAKRDFLSVDTVQRGPMNAFNTKPQKIQRHKRPHLGATQEYGIVDEEFETFSKSFPKEWIKK